jgi:hypothetical protein
MVVSSASVASINQLEIDCNDLNDCGEEESEKKLMFLVF